MPPQQPFPTGAHPLPESQKRRSTGLIVGLSAIAVILVLGIIGGLVWAGLAMRDNDNPSDAEYTALVTKFITDMSTYSPADPSGLERTQDSICDSGPLAAALKGSLDATRELAANSKVTSSVTDVTAGIVIDKRTERTIPVLVSFATRSTIDGAADATQARRNSALVTVRAGNPPCVEKLDLHS